MSVTFLYPISVPMSRSSPGECSPGRSLRGSSRSLGALVEPPRAAARWTGGPGGFWGGWAKPGSRTAPARRCRRRRLAGRVPRDFGRKRDGSRACPGLQHYQGILVSCSDKINTPILIIFSTSISNKDTQEIENETVGIHFSWLLLTNIRSVLNKVVEFMAH